MASPLSSASSSAFAGALAERYDDVAATLPGSDRDWLRGARRAHFDAFLRQGLPGPREERWRYTPLRTLSGRRFVPADANAAQRAVDIEAIALAADAPRLVFVNGVFREDLSSPAPLSGEASVTSLARTLEHGGDAEPTRLLLVARRYEAVADAFAQLNTAFAADGALVDVPAGVDAGVLHVVFVGAPADGDVAWHVRSRVQLGEGASLTLVEHHVDAGAHAHLGNALLHVHVRPAATLHHVRIVESGDGASLIARTDAHVAGGALYRPMLVELSGGLSRHELGIRLEGRDTFAGVRAAVSVNGTRRVDTRLSLDHAAPQSFSDTVWRGIADGRARAAFHGGIAIRDGGDGCDAALDCKSLLLSQGAEIDAQPVLEIHADEVKASHGAAIGQLDAASLFYLRARGIPEAQARAMLTFAFVRAVLDDVPVDALRDALASRLQRALEPA